LMKPSCCTTSMGFGSSAWSQLPQSRPLAIHLLFFSPAVSRRAPSPASPTAPH
jgi:hypothetical protein